MRGEKTVSNDSTLESCQRDVEVAEIPATLRTKLVDRSASTFPLTQGKLSTNIVPTESQVSTTRTNRAMWCGFFLLA